MLMGSTVLISLSATGLLRASDVSIHTVAFYWERQSLLHVVV